MFLRESIDRDNVADHLQAGYPACTAQRLLSWMSAIPRYRFIAERHGDVWRIDAKVTRPNLKIEFSDNGRL